MRVVLIANSEKFCGLFEPSSGTVPVNSETEIAVSNVSGDPDYIITKLGLLAILWKLTSVSTGRTLDKELKWTEDWYVPVAGDKVNITIDKDGNVTFEKSSIQKNNQIG
jgi:hypothetical protein